MSEVIESIEKSINNSNYSLSETVIGRWTDGRKRYRKIINENKTYTGGSTNFSFLIDTGLSKTTVDMSSIIMNVTVAPNYNDPAHRITYTPNQFNLYGQIKGNGYSSTNNIQVEFISGSSAWSQGNVPIKFLIQLEYCYL